MRDLTIRSTWFDNRVTNPVSNVTVSQTGANVTQQRQNLGETRIWGVQTDAEYRLGSFWRFSGGYLYNQAKVTDGGLANAALVGKFLPQVPVNRGSVRVAYTDPKYVNVALGLQFIGKQFDDDQNSRVVPAQALSDADYPASTEPGLPGYAVLDLSAQRAIGRNLEVFFGMENALDRQYFVGTLPTTTGTPRLVNGGVRLRWSGR